MATVEATAERSGGSLDRLLASVVRLDAEVLVYAALVVFGIATRFTDLETRVMSHDESLHTYYSWQLEQGRGFQHTPLMHGPMQFHIVALSYFLFGDSDAAARVPVALAGVAAIGMLAFFRRWLGRAGALAAAAMLAVSPFMLYYSRYVRNESFVVVEGLLMFWAVFRYFETRHTRWLYLLSAALMLHSVTKETSFIYTGQLLLFLGGIFAWRMLSLAWERPRWKPVFAAGLVTTLAGTAVTLFMLFRARAALPSVPETGAPLDPATADLAGTGAFSPVVALGLILAVAGLLLAAVPLIVSFGSRLRREFPALDMLVIAGSVSLPLLAALPANLLGWDPMAYEDLTSDFRTLYVVVALLAISVAIGIAWDWRRWLTAFGIFYLPFVVLYSTLFTNPLGVYSGLVGSLGYWIEQHGVRRGSQPWYYYLVVQVPVYEYLPALGSILAAVLALARRPNGGPAKPAPGAADGTAFPAIPFLGYWVVTSIAAYSFAGERMPWLTVHIALPMILLGGWAIGCVLEAIDWRAVADRRGWLILGLLLVAMLAAGAAVGQLFGPNPPFGGQDLAQLSVTTSFLTVVAAGAAAAAVIWILLRRAPELRFDSLATVIAFAVLFLLTARTAFRAAYVNGDNATEFLVYAHSATGVKTVLEQVEQLSRRTTDGMGIGLAYDDDVSWPFTWYLRNFTQVHYFGPSPGRDLLNDPVVIAGDSNWAKVEPILGDRYFSFEYIRMWWPMQDYWDLTWERIRNAAVSPEYRAALWDIWFHRDYTAYGALTGVDFALENWSPSDRMRLYVRKDIEALIWEYGVAPTVLEVPAVVDPYREGTVALAADRVVGGAGTAPGQFQTPHDVAVASDGTLYVADTFNHRIQHLAPDGTVLHTWGRFASLDLGEAPGGTFNEPWGIGVARDGRVYVADTWNHRVQWFSPEGRFLGMVGTYGLAESLEAMWGPREVAIDGQGRFFVADTGNKRILVFDRDGAPLGEFGGRGVLPGLFDEPVGVALDADGRLLVADTWNQRIQTFDVSAGSGFPAIGEWPIDAWYGQSLQNKPYLAISPDGAACASDPEGYRILCFLLDGTFVKAFGSYGQAGDQFGLPSGLDFAPDGALWVVDSGNSRLMRFTPDLAPEGISRTGAGAAAEGV